MRLGHKRRIGAEILACFMKGPRTLMQIVEMVGCTHQTAERWVRDLRLSGLLYVTKWHPNVYHLQPSPFVETDAPRTRKRKAS
jgi:hypothetical protein